MARAVDGSSEVADLAQPRLGDELARESARRRARRALSAASAHASSAASGAARSARSASTPSMYATSSRRPAGARYRAAVAARRVAVFELAGRCPGSDRQCLGLERASVPARRKNSAANSKQVAAAAGDLRRGRPTRARRVRSPRARIRRAEPRHRARIEEQPRFGEPAAPALRGTADEPRRRFDPGARPAVARSIATAAASIASSGALGREQRRGEHDHRAGDRLAACVGELGALARAQQSVGRQAEREVGADSSPSSGAATS